MLHMRTLALGAMFLALGVMTGCKPSSANIALRKQNQQLQLKLAQAEAQRQADLARLNQLEGGTTRPVISQAQLDRLFTTCGLRIGKLTGGYRNDSTAAADDGVVIHVVPTDKDGQDLKSAGRFSVHIFDLEDPDRPLVGMDDFSLEDSRQAWNGYAMLYNYVLKVPFTRKPLHARLLVKLDFFDELSTRKFSAEREVTVAIAPAK